MHTAFVPSCFTQCWWHQCLPASRSFLVPYHTSFQATTSQLLTKLKPTRSNLMKESPLGHNKTLLWLPQKSPNLHHKVSPNMALNMTRAHSQRTSLLVMLKNHPQWSVKKYDKTQEQSIKQDNNDVCSMRSISNASICHKSHNLPEHRLISDQATKLNNGAWWAISVQINGYLLYFYINITVTYTELNRKINERKLQATSDQFYREHL